MSGRKVAKLIRGERGVALVEFALVAPLALVLLFGILDFGKAINYWIDETHLASEGSRWAVVDKWPTKGTSTLQQYILSQLDTAELHGDNPGTQGSNNPAQVCISFPSGTSNVGDPVRVEVRYTYHWLHYLTAQAGLGATSTITGSSTMRIEA